MNLPELIAAVKKHAMDNYEASFGWSEVIECWEDNDIAEAIGDADLTPTEAIKRVADFVSIRDERYREAVGPEVECPECGTKFGENTACPNWRSHE